MACSNPECQSLRQEVQELREELLRVKSAGYDMLKQRGAWQCAGKTHIDFSLEFADFFDHDVEDMFDCLKASSMDEEKARQFLCNAFQSVYDKCKEQILEKMKGALSSVLTTDDSKIGAVTTASCEELYDVCRAYGLLIHASGVTKRDEYDRVSQEVCREVLNDATDISVPESKLMEFTGSISQLAWNLLTTVPPLVCSQPNTTFCKECHQKEMKPLWKADITDYRLVYYRPVLYLSYEGKVAHKGWVGNTTIERKAVDSPTEQSKDLSCSNTQDVERKPDHIHNVVISQCQLHVAGEQALKRHKVRSIPKETRHAQVTAAASDWEVLTPKGDRGIGFQRQTSPKPPADTTPMGPLTHYWLWK